MPGETFENHRVGGLAGVAVLGWLFVVMLFVAGVSRHPASLGAGLFAMDLALLAGCGALLVWGWRQQRSSIREALAAGAPAGVVLGLVLISSHTIEWFGLDRNTSVQFARGAGSTLLMLGLLGSAGSAAWERTRSIGLGVIAGLWCALLGTIMLLGFAFTLNLAFETHAVAWLHDAFVASGMSDPGAFVVRNALESASEVLVRLPVAGVVLSFLGSISNAWIMPRPRSFSLFAACFVPFVFVVGVFSLWYAGSLDRAARPPFIMAGVIAAGIAVCGAHPVWSSLLRTRRGLTRAS